MAAVAAGLGALAAIILQARRRQPAPRRLSPAAPYSHRDQQPEIVEEWGEESFPASDPPQSW